MFDVHTSQKYQIMKCLTLKLKKRKLIFNMLNMFSFGYPFQKISSLNYLGMLNFHQKILDKSFYRNFDHYMF